MVIPKFVNSDLSEGVRVEQLRMSKQSLQVISKHENRMSVHLEESKGSGSKFLDFNQQLMASVRTSLLLR